MTKNEKERLKHRFDESKKIDKKNAETSDEKYKSNVKKAIIITCIIIAIGAITLTVFDPEMMAKLDMFSNKAEISIENTEETTDTYETVEQSNNVYYVDRDTYYAYAFDSDFLKGQPLSGITGYFPYSTPDIKNGVLDCFDNLTYYFTESIKTKNDIKAVLNPEIENPSLYLVVKVSGDNNSGVLEEYDGQISMITLCNRNTGDMITYVPAPEIRFICN